MHGFTAKSNLTSLNSPQSRVAGHCFGSGFVSASQLDVLQLTAPGVPDWPASTPHLVGHPLGSPCTHVPKEWVVFNNQEHPLGTPCTHGSVQNNNNIKS